MNERIVKTAWNQMDSQSRDEALHAIYPEYQMVNHKASSKWHQIPQAARKAILRLAARDMARPRRVAPAQAVKAVNTRNIIELAAAQWVGVQPSEDGPIVMFRDPVTTSTLALLVCRSWCH